MAMNAAQHKIVNLLKTLWKFFVLTCHNVINGWLKTTLLLPVWHRDAKRLDVLCVDSNKTVAWLLWGLNEAVQLRSLAQCLEIGNTEWQWLVQSRLLLARCCHHTRHPSQRWTREISVTRPRGVNSTCSLRRRLHSIVLNSAHRWCIPNSTVGTALGCACVYEVGWFPRSQSGARNRSKQALQCNVVSAVRGIQGTAGTPGRVWWNTSRSVSLLQF